MADYLTIENLKIAISVIFAIVIFIVELKRRGMKSALVSVMKSIEVSKLNQDDLKKQDIGIAIAKQIREDWYKKHPENSISKVGKVIDKVYESDIKTVSSWIDDFRKIRATEETEEKKEEPKKE